VAGVPLLLLPPTLAAEPGGPAKSKLEFQNNVTEFTLANGMHFIVLERKEAPTVSCHL